MSNNKRGRPKLPTSPAKEKLTNAAEELFRKRGLYRVSVESICHEADVSKMSFYRHFRNKTDIALLHLERFFSREIEWCQALISDHSSYEEKMMSFYKRRRNNVKYLGSRLLGDLSETSDKEILKFNRIWSDKLADVNRSFFSLGRDLGKISSEVTEELFFFFLNKRNELFADPSLKIICPNTEMRHRLIDQFFYFGIGGSNYERTHHKNLDQKNDSPSYVNPSHSFSNLNPHDSERIDGE